MGTACERRKPAATARPAAVAAGTVERAGKRLRSVGEVAHLLTLPGAGLQAGVAAPKCSGCSRGAVVLESLIVRAGA